MSFVLMGSFIDSWNDVHFICFIWVLHLRWSFSTCALQFVKAVVAGKWHYSFGMNCSFAVAWKKWGSVWQLWCVMMCHDVAHAVMVRLLGQACKLMSWPTVGSLALAVLANNGRQQPPQIVFGWCAWIRNFDGIQVGWPDRQLFLLQGFIKSSSFWWLDWTAMNRKSLPRQWSWWVAFWAIQLFSPMLWFTMPQSVHVLILGCWFSMLQLGSHCHMNNFLNSRAYFSVTWPVL